MTTQARELAGIISNAGDLSFGDDVTLKSDGSILNFGADSDVTLTHVADAGLLFNSTRQLQFGDAGTYIYQSADGVLNLTSDTEVEINATTIDINGNVDISGTLTVAGALDFGDLDISNVGSIALDTITNDGTDLTLDSSGDIILDADGKDIILKDGGTEFGRLKTSASPDHFYIKSAISDNDLIFQGNDGGSAITALTLDMSAAGAATFNDKIIATELDISGNADIDGTLEADVITVDGTALNEYIADTVGAMVGSNTESGITVAYQDGDNTLDFTVGTLNQDTTGLAGTATALASARTIGGTSFDGTANIAVGLAGTATALATARTIGGTSFDGTANIVPGTATALATARTIAMTGDVVWSSGSFDGSGNVTAASTIQTDAVDIAMLSATGTASSSTFLRGDNSWTAVSTPITALNNATANELVTVGSTTTELDAEANLTFDGSTLTVAGEVSMTTLDIGGTNVSSTAAELNYVDGVTSAIQTQMDTKASTGKAWAMQFVFG